MPRVKAAGMNAHRQIEVKLQPSLFTGLAQFGHLPSGSPLHVSMIVGSIRSKIVRHGLRVPQPRFPPCPRLSLPFANRAKPRVFPQHWSTLGKVSEGRRPGAACAPAAPCRSGAKKIVCQNFEHPPPGGHLRTIINQALSAKILKLGLQSGAAG